MHKASISQNCQVQQRFCKLQLVYLLYGNVCLHILARTCKAAACSGTHSSDSSEPKCFTPPLYFAKFTFSEIICFVKRLSPRSDILRRAVVFGGVVMAGTRLIWFVLQWVAICMRAAFVRLPYQPCSSCLRVSHGYFAGVGGSHRYFPSIIYSEFVVANTQPRDARNCALSPGKQCGEYPVGF